MLRGRPLVIVALLLAGALAGCFGNGGDDGEPADRNLPSDEWPRCQDPWPCGDGTEWPSNLTGPFDIMSKERVTVTSHDDTALNGWILRPDTGDVPVPVILHGTPYIGQTRESPENDNIVNNGNLGYKVGGLIENGFAVAIFQVRGTGLSGGCFDFMAIDEQLDQVALIEWLAEQPWSNGRIAMSGLSYHGTTPIEAAIHAPPALKTIHASGIVTDLYQFYATPQGALRTTGVTEQASAADRTIPPNPNYMPIGLYTELAPIAAERACPGLAQSLAGTAPELAKDDRDEEFWNDRRLSSSLSGVTAAVLHTQGYHDSRGHTYQDTWFWEDLPESTPKYFIHGQWSHEFPNTNDYREEWVREDWLDIYLDWMNFWLKGLGAPPAKIGTVDFQDDAGEWHASSAWPPNETTLQAFYLTEDGLSTQASSGTTAFNSVPDEEGARNSDDSIGFRGGEQAGPMCPHESQPPNAYLLFQSEPLMNQTLLAGNPVGLLALESTLAGGIVHLSLLDLAPDFACVDGDPEGAQWIAQATADLRFHAGNMAGTDFPTATKTLVRFDFSDAAAIIEAGHSIAIVASYGDPEWRGGQSYPTTITVHGDSVIMVPLDGVVGATPTDIDLPPRPFSS